MSKLIGKVSNDNKTFFENSPKRWTVISCKYLSVVKALHKKYHSQCIGPRNIEVKSATAIAECVQNIKAFYEPAQAISLLCALRNIL